MVFSNLIFSTPSPFEPAFLYSGQGYPDEKRRDACFLPGILRLRRTEIRTAPHRYGAGGLAAGPGGRKSGKHPLAEDGPDRRLRGQPGPLGRIQIRHLCAGEPERLDRLPSVIPEIALPIGISFYTFQLLSHVVDVYRGEVPAQRDFSKLLLYTSLFHQCIAGPIVRYRDVGGNPVPQGQYHGDQPGHRPIYHRPG